MPNPKEIKLKFPVEVIATNGSKSIMTSVTVRRPKARELRNLPSDGSASENPNVMAIALCCGIPFHVAEDIDIEDTFNIMTEIPSLMPGFLGNGNKSSGESPEPITSLPKQSGK